MALALPKPLRKSLYFGTFIHNVSLPEIEILENTAIGVDENGVILFIERGIERGYIARIAESHGWTEWDSYVHQGKRTEFWFPGFVGEFVDFTATSKSSSFTALVEDVVCYFRAFEDYKQ